MGRIRPTRSQHGVDGYVIITSDEVIVRVVYAAQRELGSREVIPGREFALLAYSDEHARDVAKALRLLLGAGTDLIRLPYILRHLDFTERPRGRLTEPSVGD